jgi:hypothetical protein
VITLPGSISNAEFSSLSLESYGNKAKHKGGNLGNLGADDSSGDVKPWSKAGAVFEKWWEISE